MVSYNHAERVRRILGEEYRASKQEVAVPLKSLDHSILWSRPEGM